VPDDVLDLLKANDGIVMVTFVAGFTSPEVARINQPLIAEFNRRAKGISDPVAIDALRKEIFDGVEFPPVTIAQVADHIDYIAKRIGVRHLGIGSDFDGNDTWPVGLSNVSTYPNLFAELVRRGWKDEDLEALAGRNALRVMRTAEAIAARMQTQR